MDHLLRYSGLLFYNSSGEPMLDKKLERIEIYTCSDHGSALDLIIEQLAHLEQHGITVLDYNNPTELKLVEKEVDKPSY